MSVLCSARQRLNTSVNKFFVLLSKRSIQDQVNLARGTPDFLPSFANDGSRVQYPPALSISIFNQTPSRLSNNQVRPSVAFVEGLVVSPGDAKPRPETAAFRSHTSPMSCLGIAPPPPPPCTPHTLRSGAMAPLSEGFAATNCPPAPIRHSRRHEHARVLETNHPRKRKRAQGNAGCGVASSTP